MECLEANFKLFSICLGEQGFTSTRYGIPRGNLHTHDDVQYARTRILHPLPYMAEWFDQFYEKAVVDIPDNSGWMEVVADIPDIGCWEYLMV